MENICNLHLYPQPVDQLKDNELMGYYYSGVLTYGKFVFDNEDSQVKFYNGGQLLITFKVNKDTAFRRLYDFISYFKHERLITPIIGVSYNHILFWLMSEPGQMFGMFDNGSGDYTTTMEFVTQDRQRYDVEKIGISNLFTRFACQSNQWDDNVITMSGNQWFISFKYQNLDRRVIQIDPDSKGLSIITWMNKAIIDDDQGIIEDMKIKLQQHYQYSLKEDQK